MAGGPLGRALETANRRRPAVHIKFSFCKSLAGIPRGNRSPATSAAGCEAIGPDFFLF